MNELPAVSYVMPVLNEAGYVESAVRSILDQEYPSDTEIVLALGPSTDGTDEIVARMQAEDPRIQSVRNPGMDIPIGLNAAIRASRHPVIVRVDAHTELPDGYTARAVRTLLDTGAANVGGIMNAVGLPGLQAAVAWAYNSRLGLGGGAYHSADEPPGPAESAYLGVLRAEAFDAIGGFDDTVRRGEDWELNQRFRAAGYLVWLDPQLVVSYWPRSTWTALLRQFWATGVWRGELVRRLRRSNSARFFAPPVLVAVTGVFVVLVPPAASGRVPTWLAALFGAGPVSYLTVLAAVATKGPTVADGLRRSGVLAAMHFSWGAGFLVGVLRGAGDSVDTSRTPAAVT